LNFQCLYW